MVKPKTATKKRSGFACPFCRRFVDMEDGIKARLSDDPNVTAVWFHGRPCRCGASGNVCMHKRGKSWLPCVVAMVKTEE